MQIFLDTGEKVVIVLLMFTTTDIIYILDDKVEVTVEFDVEIVAEYVRAWGAPEGIERVPAGELAGYTVIGARETNDAGADFDWLGFEEEIKGAMDDLDLTWYVEDHLKNA